MKAKGLTVLLFYLCPYLFADQAIFNQLNDDTLLGFTRYERVIYWSEYLLGRPYSSEGPLGEGAFSEGALGEGTLGSWDSDPLYRFDTFDCTTFVETTLALANSIDKESFEREIIKIRYENETVDYFHRAHIITYAWLPNVISKNYISKQDNSDWNYALKTTTTKFDYISWLSQKLQQLNETKINYQSSLNSFSEQHTHTEIESNYLDINLLLRNWGSFEQRLNGAFLINIVRPNWNLEEKIGTDLLVSHQGWVYRDKSSGEITMLHASTSGYVVKLPLKDYLKRVYLDSPFRGIQLFKVNNSLL